MKKIPIFLFVLMLVFAVSLPIDAGQLTGRDIALKMDAVDTSLNSNKRYGDTTAILGKS